MRRSCIRSFCQCGLYVVPNRAEPSHYRLAPRQILFSKAEDGKRYRGTSTCGYPHPTLSPRWSVIACGDRVPFKNEYGTPSFVISRTIAAIARYRDEEMKKAAFQLIGYL